METVYKFVEYDAYKIKLLVGICSGLYAKVNPALRNHPANVWPSLDGSFNSNVVLVMYKLGLAEDT